MSGGAVTIEDEEHRYHLFRKLRYEKGLSNEEIIEKVYPGRFFGGRTLQEKVVKLDEWWELDLGDIPPRDRKRYGEPGSGRDAAHTTDLTTNSRTYSINDIEREFLLLLGSIGVGLVPNDNVPERLEREGWGAPPPTMLLMCNRIKYWKTKGFFDVKSNKYSPILNKIFVEDGGLVLDVRAHLKALRDQARYHGVFDDANDVFNESYVYDDYFRARGMGQGIPDRRKVPTRLDKNEYVAKMCSAERSDPARIKAKVYLELKKADYLRKSEGRLLDLSKAPSNEEVEAYVSNHHNSAYARWMVSNARAKNGCCGPRDDRGSCPGLCGPGSGRSGMGAADVAPKAVAVVPIMQAAHEEEGTDKAKEPSEMNGAELSKEVMLPLCICCHGMETGMHNRVEKLAVNFNSKKRTRVSNQFDFNSVKIGVYGDGDVAYCICPGCRLRNRNLSDATSPHMQIIHTQHVSAKHCIVIERTDGTREVVVEPKVDCLSEICKANNQMFVASSLSESVKTVPLCANHHFLVDHFLDQDELHKYLGFKDKIKLPGKKAVSGYLLKEQDLDAKLTRLFNKLEQHYPGFVEEKLRRSNVLNLAIPEGYEPPVAKSSDAAEGAGAAKADGGDGDGGGDDGDSPSHGDVDLMDSNEVAEAYTKAIESIGGEMPGEVAKKSNGEVKDEYEEAIRKLGLQ